MNGITVDIKDYSDEINNLKDLAIYRALEIIGGKCEGYAAGLAPVDTGNLKGSITHEVHMDEKAVYIGTDVEYAIYQEFGTSKMDAANGGKGYLRPAVQEHLAEYKNIAIQELKGAF